MPVNCTVEDAIGIGEIGLFLFAAGWGICGTMKNVGHEDWRDLCIGEYFRLLSKLSDQLTDY